MNCPDQLKDLEMEKDLLKYYWKTEPCFKGDECWCRLIVPIGEDINPDDDYIIPSGTLGLEEAEHIVELHNQHLKSLTQPI